MWSTSKTNDRRATTFTSPRDFQLPVASQQSDAPIVWIERSLLAELCGEADRAGPDGASGYLSGHWASRAAEAVVTTWSWFDREDAGSVHRSQVAEEAGSAGAVEPARRAAPTAGVIGIWSATSFADGAPRWPRIWHRRLATELRFDPNAPMLQLVLEEGSIWRPTLWLWSKRRWFLPRAVVRPRAADIRLAPELKGV
jgi:hypothetical protein